MTMADPAGVLVVAEAAAGRLASITLEILGIGRKLADELGEELSAVLPADEADCLSPELVAYGADRVYLLPDPSPTGYEPDVYAAALARVCEVAHPSVLLMGQTERGQDLAPRLAFRLAAGLTLDCLDLAIDPESRFLLMTKPVFSGKVHAVYITERKPQMATVRMKAFAPAARTEGRTGQVVPLTAATDPAPIRTKILKRVEEQTDAVRLEDARVVVSGGGGLGEAENYRYIQELATLLGGATGATRRIIDYGWVASKLQVGLTGKIVSPDLYVAVALSGSLQHLAGCSASRCIVAFNRDPEAPIFTSARYGVVGDFKQSLPAFIQKVKELLAQ
jgi:electron transfer flavoprotein alpha subunit